MALVGCSHLSSRNLSVNRAHLIATLGGLSRRRRHSALGTDWIMVRPALKSGQAALISGPAAPNALQSML